MILNFRVSNYRSFREEASLSLLATRLDHGFGFPVRIAADDATVEVLPVIAVLGANASGKSNLLRAISFMRTLVVSSATKPPFETLTRDHFRFDPVCADEPTLMEIDFAFDGNRYQYGFELRENMVSGEWLQTFPHKRAQSLFDREEGDYQFGKKLGGQNRLIAEITRPNVLFLSSAAQAGHPLLTRIYNFFLNELHLLDVPARGQAEEPMISRIQQRHRRAVQLLALADLGILDARVVKTQTNVQRRKAIRDLMWERLPESLSEEQKETQLAGILATLDEEKEVIQLLHRTFGRAVALPFEEESLGTKSWLSFVAYALDALETGGTLLVDELDASLHPLLMVEAIQLFQSPKLNRLKAQLIFTTHDTTMLGATSDRLKLSRGQFWFTEKSDHGASTLVPLSDFRPRKNEDLERGYLQGRYGGTPRIMRTPSRESISGSVS